MKLDNWALVSIPDPYKPPETMKQYLHGEVSGNPKFVNGSSITTSRFVGITRKDGKYYGRTNSGSLYELGHVNPEYEKTYPDALNRLINRSESNGSFIDEK